MVSCLRGLTVVSINFDGPLTNSLTIESPMTNSYFTFTMEDPLEQPIYHIDYTGSDDQLISSIKVHIPPLTKFRPETPVGSKDQMQKISGIGIVVFSQLSFFSFEKSQNYDLT